jgi:hypothetical protein
VAAGVGLASGEFILWPYIASQVGLIFLWAAAIGIITQWFINMEIERYTLATGETALTGFSRFWRHWGLVFAIMVYFANLWPGWATSSATMVTYLFGGEATGEATWIAIAMMVVIGVTLTLAPVVYTALERVEFLKVGLVVLFIVVAALFAISADAWSELPKTVTAPRFPSELGFALMLSALAFAGAGGGQNLCQSNWIRDKGFGMGVYVPRLDRGLHQPARRRRAEDGVRAERLGEPPLLRPGVGSRGDRLHRLVDRFRPAAGPAGDLRVGRRLDDVHLLDPAARSEPAGPAGADPRALVPDRGPGLGGAAVRRPGRAHHLAAGAAAVRVTGTVDR